MQWINSITSTAIACSGVLFFSTDYFALLRKSTADGNTHTDGMWHLEGMMGREDGKGNILTFLCFLLCLYTSLWALPSSSSPPDSLVPTNSHINNNPLETPFFYPTAFCCVLLLPILTLIHRVCVCVCVCVCVYFLCKFSQDAHKMLEKSKRSHLGCITFSALTMFSSLHLDLYSHFIVQWRLLQNLLI